MHGSQGSRPPTPAGDESRTNRSIFDAGGRIFEAPTMPIPDVFSRLRRVKSWAPPHERRPHFSTTLPCPQSKSERPRDLFGPTLVTQA